METFKILAQKERETTTSNKERKAVITDKTRLDGNQ